MATKHITGYVAFCSTLDLNVWSLGFAAWIFTGYSSRSLTTSGKIIRLVDDERVPHGTIEFREAERQRNQILKLLRKRVGESVGTPLIYRKDSEDKLVQEKLMSSEQFDRNWLIDQVVNHFDDEDKIELWWVNKGIKDYALPAYIRPSALNDSTLKSRGYKSFTRPSKPAEVINPLDEPSLKSSFLDGQGNIEATTKTPARSNVSKALYERSGIAPKSRFYKIMLEKIEGLINDIPEVQFDGFPAIEGWNKHCRPRPTAKEIHTLILEFVTDTWDIRIDEYGTISCEELNPPDGEVPEKATKVGLNTLTARINEWFNRTEAGYQHFKYIEDMKKLN